MILKIALKTKIDSTQFRTDIIQLGVPDELAHELTLAFQTLYIHKTKQIKAFSLHFE
jgi:hypothetical protein